jgi:hypothetical protein
MTTEEQFYSTIIEEYYALLYVEDQGKLVDIFRQLDSSSYKAILKQSLEWFTNIDHLPELTIWHNKYKWLMKVL